MEKKIEDIYTKDGKKLLELVQEWIDENNFFSNCKDDKERRNRELETSSYK